MSYDAWTSGLVLAPSGFGRALMLLLIGRLVTRMDQRILLAFGVLMNGLATYLMSNLTLIPFMRPVRPEPAHRPVGEAVAPLPAPTE